MYLLHVLFVLKAQLLANSERCIDVCEEWREDRVPVICKAATEVEPRDWLLAIWEKQWLKKDPDDLSQGRMIVSKGRRVTLDKKLERPLWKLVYPP